jgi:tRNA 2-thiouridine synthesizing protein A
MPNAAPSSSAPEPIELDATGLICPMPVLKANRALRALPVGGRLKVRATDPAAAKDFPAYCAQTGHVLEESGRDGEVLVFVLRKTESGPAR